MKKTTSYFLLLFLIGYCFSSAFSQNPPTLGYVIEVKLVDGGSYSNFYPTLQEARKDPVLAHFGVLYDPEYNSLKLHGDGLLNINGAGATFYNVQYEDWKPRSGSELELREDHPDTLTVAIVFWKLGGRHVVKEYKTYRKITDDMRPGTSRPQMPPKSPQEQTIRLNKALTWKSHTTLDQKIWNIGSPGVKVTVVNFWFAGCKPCVDEIPELNKLVARYAKDSVEFVAFSLDTEGMIKQFLAKTPFHYRIIPNARETAEKLGIKAYPTHLVIDEEGQVRYHGIGYEDDTIQNLEQVIDGLLGKLW